jgi:DNA-binding NtrC family response regulator
VPDQNGDVETELARSIAPIDASSPLQAVVVSGVDQGARAYLAQGSTIVLGKSPICDLMLQDKLVSRRHASLERVAEGARVCDLGSTNGTFVGQVKVVDAFVPLGQSFRIGDTVIELGAPNEPAPPVSRAASFGKVLGSSAAMRAIYPRCERIAQSDMPVLIEGETGTGKEVLAESIHAMSNRANGPFVVFDCTAVAPNLIEAELFGHVKGSFTGAIDSRAGVFEQAHGGTLLIDEIGELDVTQQPKLLRLLERSEVRRVGGQKTVRFDVRVIAATRRDLDAAVTGGRFRDDLFHRLAVIRVELPPLRKRRGDLALLVRHFATQLGASSPIPYERIADWEDAPWPGNVRELRNAVARFVALGEDWAQPPPPLATTDAFDSLMSLPIAVARQKLLDQFEQAYVEHLLNLHGGDIEKAAIASGIARRQFYRLRAKARRP